MVLREDAVTNCAVTLERSISPLFHAHPSCGRRCATLFARGISAFPVDTEMMSQARCSEQQFGGCCSIISGVLCKWSMSRLWRAQKVDTMSVHCRCHEAHCLQEVLSLSQCDWTSDRTKSVLLSTESDSKSDRSQSQL